MNILLWKPKRAGEFVLEGEPVLKLPRITVFRPDIQRHSVTEVGGFRLILTFGWVIPNVND
jgi:hypothetical protein